MTPQDAVTLFEQLNIEGRAPVFVDDTCVGFADWLASAWDRLSDDEIARY
ncbi:hypothetical protein [Burkholderia sp. BDU5]|nr:hypothetical protein [Burkholderia sp. BDU5]